MEQSNYVSSIKAVGTKLSLSAQSSKKYMDKTKSGRNVLPYWYNIKPIRFIWNGEWSDPDIMYNRMVVNATIVEDTMLERYYKINQDYTEEKFAQFMTENKSEVVELIYLAHKLAR